VVNPLWFACGKASTSQHDGPLTCTSTRPCQEVSCSFSPARLSKYR